MSAVLRISGLDKVYVNGVRALRGIELEVQSGEFLGLLGPSGAGKSTLIGIISSLLLKTRGKVEIGGFDLDTQAGFAKKQLGIVPQEFNFGLFEKVQSILVTQAGYYGVPRAIALQRAEKYLKLMSLWEKRFEAVRTLSGGMKRRLMIARALMNEPEILILDEPTAGVDVEVRRAMWQFLKELNRAGKTIILTTHYLEEAEQLSDRIAIINHGQLIHDMPKKVLLTMLSEEKLILELQHSLTQSLPQCPGFEINALDPVTLSVCYTRPQNLSDLFSFLEKAGVMVASIRNEHNRLESLFLHLTES